MSCWPGLSSAYLNSSIPGVLPDNLLLTLIGKSWSAFPTKK